jgi:hypothetical protein
VVAVRSVHDASSPRCAVVFACGRIGKAKATELRSTIHKTLVQQLLVRTDLAWIGNPTSQPRTAEDADKALVANAMAREPHIHALANHFMIHILVVSIAKKADHVKIMHYQPGYMPASALTKLQFNECMQQNPAPVTLGYDEAAKHFVTLGPEQTSKRRRTAGSSRNHGIQVESSDSD